MNTSHDPNQHQPIYHVYNRGVDKRVVFADRLDYDRFLQSLAEFNSKQPIGSLYLNQFRKNDPSVELSSSRAKLVDILCYCLNPNHFHLVIQPLSETSITTFMRRLSGGYTQYFNEKYHRSGSLFQGRYKKKLIESNEALLHVYAYVSLNNFVHNYSASERAQTRSSWPDLLAGNSNPVCSGTEIITEQFSSPDKMKKYCEESLRQIRDKKEFLRNLALEELS